MNCLRYKEISANELWWKLLKVFIYIPIYKWRLVKAYINAMTSVFYTVIVVTTVFEDIPFKTYIFALCMSTMKINSSPCYDNKLLVVLRYNKKNVEICKKEWINKYCREKFIARQSYYVLCFCMQSNCLQIMWKHESSLFQHIF